MKTLTLLRHAKSDWDDPSLADHDRPLAPRGRRACRTMAKYMAERKVGPPRADLILCSTARRARDTLAAVLPALGPGPEPVLERGLYLCGADDLLARLRRVPEDVRSVLIVAHNPDLHELACALAAEGDGEALAGLRTKLPTGSLVEIALPDAPWAGLGPDQGRLVRFTTPRSLEAL